MATQYTLLHHVAYISIRFFNLIKSPFQKTSVFSFPLKMTSNKVDKQMKIGTHDGTFHCDEVLACVLLKMLPQYMNSTIVRTRNQDILDKCDIVVDVGGIYNPSIHRYDHHMRDFCETASTVLKKPNFNRKIKLSSAGLIYCHFGHEILRNIFPHIKEDRIIDQIFKQIYDTIILEIDAIDNGIPMYPDLLDQPEPEYYIHTDLSSLVKHMNEWTIKSTNNQEAFENAMAMVQRVFMSFVTRTEKVWLPAREVVQNAINGRFEIDPSGVIMELSRPVPWQQHLFHLEKEMELSPTIKFVIFPGEENYRVQCVPQVLNSFICRIFLPSEWGGLRDDALVAACGIEGAKFVHATLFIGGHKTRDGALAMAVAAYESGKLSRPLEECPCSDD
ncbi:PREDICTED: UPF0160 protein MYG1, mitochondrial-like [Dinoponera quadriceps]|uniref:UPF0160 protein MYG1, mitochondrial-like n=1 Tax=Dinoponera quadriceps TaxID=609295 RepID=A0A6P3XM30_DINQU|nr:PREDICTED: UPF0160 protein MYG1, mitochondrial-like [Dinoponera quadriceps]